MYRGVAKCFECQKLATIMCFQCQNEFDESKTFCFNCDKSVHKGQYLQHQRQAISFNQQLDNISKQPSYSTSQNYSHLDRKNNSMNHDYRSDQNVNEYRQNNSHQLQFQENPRENLQFFKDLKYTSNHQSVRNNISEDRFKNQVADTFYQNRTQSSLNYGNHPSQIQTNKFEGGRQQQQQQYLQQGNSLLSKPYITSQQNKQNEYNEERLREEFEQRQLNAQRNSRNQLENQFIVNDNRNHDSFISNEDEDKSKPILNPLQQGLSDEELENNANKIQGDQNLGYNANKQSNDRKISSNLNPGITMTKNSDQFKQQLEQEINDLKRFQNIHHNKYSSPSAEYQNNNKGQAYFEKQDDQHQLNANNGYAQEEYKQGKHEVKQHFGNQKDLNERENEVLKRISEIKQRLSPESNSYIAKEKEYTDMNRELQDSKQTQSHDIQPSKTLTIRHERYNTDDRRELEQQTEQTGSGKKFKNDFENLISQVGPNEEKSYIQGLQNVYKQEIKNIEIKHKIKVQELENTISYMRQHMDLMEERNRENINLIREDLQKQQRIAIEQERDSKYGLNEIRLQYQEEINHLQLQAETERAKYIKLEKNMQEYQSHYQNKLKEMAEVSKKSKQEAEIQKIKLQEYVDEMEEKIEDMRVRMVQENDNALQKIKIDYDSSLEDLKDQVKEKSEQIAKLEKQLVADSQQYHEKEREIKKEYQDLERQINSLRNEINKAKENSEQFKNIASEQEGELELLKRENELLEDQKVKLEEEKEKLEEQVDKYQKYIYGDKKEKSIIQSLKGQSSRPSLNRMSSQSIKSSSSKNSKKNDK